MFFDLPLQSYTTGNTKAATKKSKILTSSRYIVHHLSQTRVYQLIDLKRFFVKHSY